MQGTMGIGTGDWMGDWLAGSHRALRGHVSRTIASAVRVSAWQWAGRIGWLIGAGYATTAIVWAIMRYAG